MAKKLSISQEHKLAELEQLNLPRVWKEIAKATGPDLFIKIWRIVSTPELQHKENNIYVPSINKYYDYQRLQITRTLVAQNKSYDEIKTLLNNHGIPTSVDTIKRIAKKYHLEMAAADELEEVTGINYQMSLF